MARRVLGWAGMITLLRLLFGFGPRSRSTLPAYRVVLDRDCGNLNAGTIYRLLRPRRWTAA